MKLLDVLGTGKRGPKKPMAAAVTSGTRNREADDELRRRAEVNARGAAARAAREEALFGRRGWIPRRPGWLGLR